MKLRTGDTVLIIAGKDRGKVGSIMRVLLKKSRIVVSGINLRTKHFKKTPQQAGRRIRYEASIAVSNVMILDPKTKKPTRVGFRFDEKGRKRRISKVSGDVLERMAEEPKEIKEAKEEDVSAKPTKKPFWKRLGLDDATPGEAGEVATQPHSKEDHTIPDQNLHVRPGSRGS